MSRFHVDPTEKVDIFEFDPSEVVSDTPPNVITIRARMSIEVSGRVTSEIAKLGADNKTTEVSIGAQAVALLLHNILAWRGPDFDDLPCTPENIRSLPTSASDPFIEKVVNEIGERNKRRESPNGKPPTAHGFATNGSHAVSPASAAGISLQLATSTPKSALRSALDGHLNRSDD
jgi:hypothetical protein